MTEPVTTSESAPRRPAEVAHYQDDLILFLERDQLVADTSKPLPRARLGPRVSAALWALRIFSLVVSAMVIYTFVQQLK